MSKPHVTTVPQKRVSAPHTKVPGYGSMVAVRPLTSDILDSIKEDRYH